MGSSSKRKTASNAKAATKPPIQETESVLKAKEAVPTETLAEHLPPLGLVFAIITCSGFLFMFSFRDVFATGRVIAGTMDEAMLTFTQAVQFFDNDKGWRSTQGGLSSIKSVTTDANNMGGLFVIKVGGAACMSLQLQKLLPLLVHPAGAVWNMGHFRPLLWTAALSNLLLALFYTSFLGDLSDAGADFLPKIFIAVLVIESCVILAYLLKAEKARRGPAIALEKGKLPSSFVSRIVARTVFIVSGAMTLFAGRDLFFPGQILDFVSRDDVFLEWTGALIHSPPEGSPEAEEYGITAPLHRGDKFSSQFMAANILLLCLYKFVSSFLVRYGSDGGGLVKSRMIWKGQAIGDALILLLFRLFTSAATSASIDMRWYVISISYETFILGLYGFF